ncbi:UNVERIFIED_CONTAM: hypothetical protein Sradi_6119400 [Sesamum radiatum]|uniref:Uncharacterized protein n=1 Tax=Sesamum radiatum TaxID=300843 RepID=A0AAW2KJM9_SESRA
MVSRSTRMGNLYRSRRGGSITPTHPAATPSIHIIVIPSGGSPFGSGFPTPHVLANLSWSVFASASQVSESECEPVTSIVPIDVDFGDNHGSLVLSLLDAREN